MIWDYYMNKLSNSRLYIYNVFALLLLVLYIILIITKQRHCNHYAQQDRLRKSCIKTTLDQYRVDQNLNQPSGIIDALK